MVYVILFIELSHHNFYFKVFGSLYTYNSDKNKEQRVLLIKLIQFFPHSNKFNCSSLHPRAKDQNYC